MAYDNKLAARIQVWVDQRGGIEGKAMFGGYCYLVGGNMMSGVKDANLLLRLGPAGDRHQGEPHILPFPTWARPMSGFLQVEPAGCATDDVLAAWLERAHAFAAALPAKRMGTPTLPLAKRTLARPATKRATAKRSVPKAKPSKARSAKKSVVKPKRR